MAPKIFATGTTGYIGGDALHHIVQAHPEYEIACLVRNSDKGAQLSSRFGTVRLVYGSLDDIELLEEEAKKADVVLNCASADHEGAAKALSAGLAARSKNQPGYLIHTSGTGILMLADMKRKRFGESSTKIYNDWDGVAEVTSLPDDSPHRTVDKIVLTAAAEKQAMLRTAIVCPPTIYGVGRGPGNQRSIQVPDLVKVTLEKKQGVQVGAGKTFWGNVHIHDLSDCYLKLVEAAIAGGGTATWGAEGYYFTENGEHVWGEISKLIASDAHKQGFLSLDNLISLSGDEANQLRPHGAYLWGANSRCRAIRARRQLGWSPRGKSIEDEMREAISIEAKALGIVQGHAAKVAG